MGMKWPNMRLWPQWYKTRPTSHLDLRLILLGTILILTFSNQVPQRPPWEAPAIFLWECFYWIGSADYIHYSQYMQEHVWKIEFVQSTIASAKNFWTQSQNKTNTYGLLHFIGTIEIHTKMTGRDKGKFSLLVAYKLSAGFDTPDVPLFLKHSVHLAPRYYFVCCSYSVSSPPTSVVTPSRNIYWSLHILRSPTLVSVLRSFPYFHVLPR